MDTRLNEEPPASNTGVLTTTVRLDYLSFTLENSEENFERLWGLVDATDIKILAYGGLGYIASANILDGGRVFWHPERLEMGIHVKLNARSLALIEMCPIGLLNRVRHWAGKITRLDIAFDDKSAVLDMDEMYKKILKGEVVTRWRTVTRVSGARVGDDKKIGDTINVGSRVSESFLRIYDKKQEMIARGKDVSEVDTWTRVELELKGDKANAFGLILAETALGGGLTTAAEQCASLLAGLLEFKEENPHDVNKTRWLQSPFWLKFVGNVSKLTLSLPKTIKTLDDSKEWVRSQASATLAMIVLSEDDDLGQTGYQFIMNCIVAGQNRLSKEQRRRLEVYNRVQRGKIPGKEPVGDDLQ